MKKIFILVIASLSCLFLLSCASVPEVSKIPDTNNQRETYFVNLTIKGKTAQIQSFLSAYPDVNLDYIDAEGFAALHYAIGYKNDNLALLLIDDGANVQLPTRAVWRTMGTINEGATPLHIAVFWSRMDVVEKLLQKGANPNAQDSLGYTPLHVATYYGIKGPVDALLAAGAKNIPDNEGNTPLMNASSFGYSAIERKIANSIKE